MVGTILLVLFIGQVLSFYFIVLLYTKISKLKDVEKGQTRLKDEMDNAIGAYLAEMRDENDRLIRELTTNNQNSYKEEKNRKDPNEENEKNRQHSSIQGKFPNPINPTNPTNPIFNTPRNIVAKAYQKSPTAITTEDTLIENDSIDENVTKSKHPKETLTLKEQVQELYVAGKNIDEIAKLLQKGKTEIELLLKFQQ